jgi:predicted HAD superfamily Cof-like phosphohydrolase
MRSAHQQRVDEFMRLAGQELPTVPTIPSDEVRLLRAKLILEEAIETIHALGVTVIDECGYAPLVDELTFKITGPMDIVEVVDGCCDTIVVTTGTLSAIGVSDEAMQQAIDESNLAKFGPGGHRRDDGKWIKPPDHKAPDILALLTEQGYKAA